MDIDSLQLFDCLSRFWDQVCCLESLKKLRGGKETYGLEYVLFTCFFKVLGCSHQMALRFPQEITEDMRERVRGTLGDLEELENEMGTDLCNILCCDTRKCKDLIKNVPFMRKLLWMNLSFWDTEFGRMPLLGCVVDKNDEENFKNFWDEYWNYTKNQAKNQVYTLNEFVSRCENITEYIVCFEDVPESVSSLGNNGVIIISLPPDPNNKSVQGSLEKFSPPSSIKNVGQHSQAVIECRKTWLKSTNQQLKCIYFFPYSLERILLPATEIKELKRMAIIAVGTKEFLELQEYYLLKNLFHMAIKRLLMLNFSQLISRKQKALVNHALRSAVAAIMARNMSHNIGSHVLASPDLLMNAQTDEIQEIQTLHNFLQQRMDFISQVVTYQPTYAEPCFIFRDMLRNFLNQSLLLGHLIKDIGYDGSKIKFYILCNGSEIEFAFNHEAGGWWKDLGSNIKDTIIGVPGGPIGFHAFYDIIENIMRNSAKYGIRQDEMNIYIQLEDRGTTSYLVTVWDNLSPAQRNVNNIVEALNNKLKERLIDETGQVVAESRGIHEMKKCAAILVSSFEKELNFNQYDLNGQLLHIYAVKKSYNEKDYLGYQFFLQKPRLVTIVGNENVNEEAKKVGVFTAELKDLIKHPPQIALIFESEKLKLSNILNFISQNHHLLPYRILLVRSEGIREGDQFHSLPHNRVAFCNQSDIQFPSNTGSIEEWEKFVIDVHKLWLKKRYGDNKYILAINIDRGPNHSAFARWSNCLQNFWLHDILDIFVTFARQQGGWQGIRAVNPQQSQLLNKQPDKQKNCLMSQINERYQNVLLYDNHGALTLALGIDRSLCRFYHETGIKVALRLSQALESPPETPFAFNWFVLGLLEAGLTTVVIVDERLGEATFGAEQRFNKGDGLLGRLREAGIFPIYKFNGIFISDALESTNNRWIEHGFRDVIHSEGMQVNDGVSICAQKPDGTYEQLENADVIIIHQGVIDRLHEMGKWQENFVNKLYQSSPSVIITSGRGKTLRHVPVTMPFLEFSIIRACTYAELSKYHLVRAIKSVVGSKKKEVNKP